MTDSGYFKRGNFAINSTILGASSGWKREFVPVGSVPHVSIKDKTIYAPPFGQLTENEERLVYASDLHENAHALLTPRDPDPSMPPLMKELVNAMEDMRIEKVLGDMYPSAAGYFRWSNDYLLSKVVPGSCNPYREAIFSLMADSMGIRMDRTDEAQALADIIRDEFSKMRGVKDFSTRKGYEGILRTAKACYELWEQDGKNKQQNSGGQDDRQQNSEEQSGESGQSGDSNGSKNDSSQPEDVSDSKDSQHEGSDDSDGPADDSGDEDGSGKESGQDSGSDSESEQEDGGRDGEQDEDGPSDGEEQNQGGYSEQGSDDRQSEEDGPEDQSEGHGGLKPGGHGHGLDNSEKDAFSDFEEEGSIDDIRNGEISGISRSSVDSSNGYTFDSSRDTVTVPQERPEMFQSSYSRIQGQIGSLYRYIEQAMVAKTRCRRLGGLDNGRLDMRRLADIGKSLSNSVFYKKVQGEQLDTCVSICIDQSGSMHSMVRYVRPLVMAFAECLERLNIPFQIVGGTTGEFNGAKEEVSKAAASVTRWKPIRYEMFKSFSEQYRLVRNRLGSLSAYSNYIDGEMVDSCCRAMEGRKEKRKIVLSFSDGDPCAGQGNDGDMGRNLVDACRRRRQQGFCIYGFGIGTEDPKKWYGADNFIHLADGNSMDSQFLSAVVGIMGLK